MEASGLIELGHLNIPRDLELRIVFQRNDNVLFYLQTPIGIFSYKKGIKRLFTRNELIFDKRSLQSIIDSMVDEYNEINSDL